MKFKKAARKEAGPGSGAPGPQTLMGQFWRAAMLRHSTERSRVSAEIKRTGEIAYLEYTTAAFEAMVRRWFAEDVDLREIIDFVQSLREAFGPTVPVLETESFIRHALGEDVDVSDIDGKTRIAAGGFTMMGIADLLQRDERKIDAALVEAEVEVRRKGLNPTVAQ